jgi:methylmalonyl-CoA mutase N-terminal domain/subunit
MAQIDNLKRLKAERDNERVQGTLAVLRKVAEGEGNLMAPILDAVKAYATLGEICDSLRSVFGEYQQIKTLG